MQAGKAAGAVGGAAAAAVSATTGGNLEGDVAAATTFPPELVAETPVFGAAARAEAEKQGDAVHSLGAASHAAFVAGDGAKAKELSDQAKAAGAARDAANGKAADAIWAQKNNGRDVWTVDLHLLLLQEAMDRVQAGYWLRYWVVYPLQSPGRRRAARQRGAWS